MAKTEYHPKTPQNDPRPEMAPPQKDHFLKFCSDTPKILTESRLKNSQVV
jgi:hypothetical protein